MALAVGVVLALALTLEVTRLVAKRVEVPVAEEADRIADGILPSDQATLTEQSQRLHRLVDEMSTFSRAEERQLNLNPALVSIQDVVSGAATAVCSRFQEKGVSLTKSGGSAVGLVLVDPDRLGEALGALLDNALRHTAKGGAVTVATTRNDRRCRIVVTDTGEGFAPQLAARLFERFYRGDSSRAANDPGSGVGLTIARAIIEAHHGHLVAGSDGPGQGASFEIMLPAAARSHQRNADQA